MKKILLYFVVLFISTACSKTDYSVFATLHGIVSDYETGESISGANVILSPSGITKITGDDGYFEFQDLSSQQYTITVQKTGYTTNRKSISAVSGEKTEINITIIKQ